ncbi:DUF4292 domain-containing protein [Bacteroidales bacterium OttesenSCG-928-A17]|nr:DUF4292 domain-containing protein [Bacteroidales bacterium OttesenSCG-928-A17]
MRKICKVASLLCLIAVFFNACKSSEKALQVSLQEKAKDERITGLIQHGVFYDTFSGSFRMTLKLGEKNKSTSVSSQIKIKKDEAIEISLRAPILGEIVKVFISPEQLLIIDRWNKQYFTESMDRVQSIAPFDFDYFSLQALFTNHLFIAGKPNIEEKDLESFNLKEDEFQVYLNNTDSHGINYDFVSDYTNRILKTEMYKKKEKANLIWNYQEFGLTSNNRLFPMQMNMELQLPDDVYTMNMSFSKVEINNPYAPDVTIPTKYKQISLEQVTRLIKSMSSFSI